MAVPTYKTLSIFLTYMDEGEVLEKLEMLENTLEALARPFTHYMLERTERALEKRDISRKELDDVLAYRAFQKEKGFEGGVREFLKTAEGVWGLDYIAIRYFQPVLRESEDLAAWSKRHFKVGVDWMTNQPNFRRYPSESLSAIKYEASWNETEERINRSVEKIREDREEIDRIRAELKREEPDTYN